MAKHDDSNPGPRTEEELQDSPPKQENPHAPEDSSDGEHDTVPMQALIAQSSPFEIDDAQKHALIDIITQTRRVFKKGKIPFPEAMTRRPEGTENKTGTTFNQAYKWIKEILLDLKESVARLEDHKAEVEHRLGILEGLLWAMKQDASKDAKAAPDAEVKKHIISERTKLWIAIVTAITGTITAIILALAK